MLHMREGTYFVADIEFLRERLTVELSIEEHPGVFQAKETAKAQKVIHGMLRTPF